MDGILAIEEFIKLEMANNAYTKVVILKNRIKTKREAFTFFACMNLLNSYIKKEYAQEEFKKRYIIKDYVAQAITHIIEEEVKEVDIFIDKNVAYVTVENRQFSFHYIKSNNTIREYSRSKKNIKQEWCGIRLQPICVTVFNEANAIKIK